MKIVLSAAAATSLAIAVWSMPVAAQGPVAGQAAEEAAPAYSVTTTQVGVLLDDPKAAAILQEIIPGIYANDMFQTMGRSQTLQAIQQYEPAALSDAVLARIQARFDELAGGRQDG